MHILYFAHIRETLGLAEETINCNANTVGLLLAELSQRGALWKEMLEDNTRLQISVNQTLAKRNTRITDSDEIAFFPPVTGG